ncbi:MAG: class I SAM-dependent methyltransferase [Gemmataceae bacterium]|nr:class I SAM-dependent methyltransferase [Gemmataceae bacterium]
MSDETLVSYDELPYQSHPISASHPERLAAIATLRGLTPVPVTGCRVLELGCAAGGNLIPMAVTLPDSHFVGIDLSRRQVADGQADLDALGLKNVELLHLSITDVGPEMGLFDYIICHGVYSWVPAFVQDKILRICKENLSPQGLAYISYNTYPGWHITGILRDMVLYQTRACAGPVEKVRAARAWLTFLGEALAADSGAYATLLKPKLEQLARLSDSYLLHEYLEEANEALYFHQFVERAAERGLQPLGDAHFGSGLSGGLSPEAQAALERVASTHLGVAQNVDVLQLRSFRQGLVCHDGVRLQPEPSPDAARQLYAASAVKAQGAEPDVRSDAEADFKTPDGSVLGTRDPILKAVLVSLEQAWPMAMPFEALCAGVWGRLGGVVPEGAVAVRLLRAFETDLVQLLAGPSRFVTTVSARPLASPWARWLALSGRRVTDLRHESVALEDFDRLVIRYLDGDHDQEATLGELTALVTGGQLGMTRQGAPVRDPETARAILTPLLEQSLRRLAREALLVA